MIVTNSLTQSHNEHLTPGRSGNDIASTGIKGFPTNKRLLVAVPSLSGPGA